MNTRLLLRDATPADMGAVAALYAREVLEGTATFEEVPPTAGEMTARLLAVRAKGLPWLIAEVDGKTQAWAYASPFRPRSAYRYAVESSVYVSETAQRTGLGRSLMAEVIARCRAQGMRQVIAAISNDRSDGSIALHAALGFRTVGTYSRVGWKFGRWLDVTLMQLDLGPDAGPPQEPGLSLG